MCQSITCIVNLLMYFLKMTKKFGCSEINTE